MLKINNCFPLVFLVLFFPAITIAASGEFPLREKFPETTPISIAEVHNNFATYTIIDVRSKFEFDTIHINGSQNIKVSHRGFEKWLQEAVAKDQKVVFYCNGHTCAKSYKAARKALKIGYANSLVLDAGIFEWAKAHPDKTTFLGKSPANVSQLMASKDDFASRNFPFEQFKAKASQPNTILIDIRDPYQKSKESDRSVKLELPDMPIKHINITLDKFMHLIKGQHYIDKNILIYDATGKQIKWLGYHLDAAGYTSYYFLKGGVLEATNLSSN